MSQLKQTPSQTVGPYFAYGLAPEQYNFDLKSLFSASAADREVPGEHIAIVGNVFDAEGKVVNDALVEIAQADRCQRPLRADRRGSVRVGLSRPCTLRTGTDPKLRFIFDTVKPGATDDAAPHLDVIVLMRGMLLHADLFRGRTGGQRPRRRAAKRAGRAPSNLDRQARGGTLGQAGRVGHDLPLRNSSARTERNGILRPVSRSRRHAANGGVWCCYSVKRLSFILSRHDRRIIESQPSLRQAARRDRADRLVGTRAFLRASRKASSSG